MADGGGMDGRVERGIDGCMGQYRCEDRCRHMNG